MQDLDPPANSAADALVVSHQEYVRKLARAIAGQLPRHVDFEELVAFGNVGLVEAARGYRFDQNCSFETFAYYRIRGAIYDGVGKMSGLPRNWGRYEQGQDQVGEEVAQLPPTDDPEALAGRLRKAVGALGVVFLLSQVADDDRPIDPADPNTPSDHAEAGEQTRRLGEAVAGLSSGHARIIRAVYFEGKTMTQCAEEMEVDKATVSRHHKDALRRLRERLGEEAVPAGGP